MSEKIEPALTAEEWQTGGIGVGGYWIHHLDTHDLAIEPVGGEAADVILGFAGPTRHALAALALYGQPFGFTREDVQRLNALIQALDRAETAQELLVELIVLDPEPWRSLTARIEALLPPEGR